ncbi:hypothetical protein PBRA_005689 [Plasmodiophora brassicae]|nr:hypothetical protein PBRA_005689 [Plasmodiophora brassicae]
MSGVPSRQCADAGRVRPGDVAKPKMSADDLKALGNVHYREKRFGDAVRAYRGAIDLSPGNGVCRSNLAACYFEMGRYDDCIEETRRALDIIRGAMPSGRDEDAKLCDKNRLRIAKALYFKGNFSECLSELSVLLSTEAVQKEVLDLRSSALELARRQAQDESFAESARIDNHRRLLNGLPRYRPHRITNVYEFYPVGHDDATSAMSGAFSDGTPVGNDDPNGLRLRQSVPPREDTRSAMWLSKMDASQLGNLSFFFGGVGDARHVFTTLMDVQRQMKAMTRDGEWPASDHPIWSELRVSVVLNDIAIPTFARNLIMLYALWELGAYTIEQATAVPDAVELAALIHNVYVSVTLPPYLYDRLMAIIDRLLSLSSPQDVLPFVRISSECWDSVKETLRFWRSDSFVLTTKEMCMSQNWTMADFDPVMMGLCNQDVQNQMNASMELQKRFLTQQVEQLMTPDMLAQFGGGIDKGALVQQMVDKFANTSVAALDGCALESAFIRETKSLWPPTLLAQRDPVVAAAIKAMKQHNPDRAGKLLNSVRQHIYRTWKPNVTLVSREFLELAGRCRFDHDPVAIVAQLYNVAWMKSPEKPESLFDWSAKFFAMAASSVRQLGSRNCIVYEFLPGDMNHAYGTIAIESESRRSLGLPVAFDRIFVSNVPDYTGILPVFVETAPLLKRTANSFINCTVLLNTGLFRDYGECVYSAAAIPSIQDCERYIGMKLQSGSLWKFDPRWGHVGKSPLPYDVGDLASQDELFEWVVRLVLMIAVPPERDARTPMRENYPMNLSYVFRTFERLIAIGYPRHWIATILTRLLENRFSAMAQPPLQSPNPYRASNAKPARVVLDCFLKELRALATLWQPVLRLAVNYPLPELANIHRYVLRDIEYIDCPEASGGCPTSPVMGVLFEPPSSSKRSSSVPSFLRMFTGEPVDRDLVTSTSSRVHAFTVVHFDSALKELAVWLSRDDFAEMKVNRYTVRLFQADGWTAVSSPQPVSDMVESDLTL